MHDSIIFTNFAPLFWATLKSRKATCDGELSKNLIYSNTKKQRNERNLIERNTPQRPW